jgi:hypothetical protein
LAQHGFRIGAHALRATAVTKVLDNQADIATIRIYDHRKPGQRAARHRHFENYLAVSFERE